MSRLSSRTLRACAPPLILALLAVGSVVGCERNGDATEDEVVIVTPSGGSGEATTSAGPASGTEGVITLDAITPGPLPGGDDPFCVAVITAVTDYNTALQTYVDDVLAATTAAALSNDLTGINQLGATVNALALDATDRMDDALELTDNKAARDGITGMIEYLEVYLVPVALIMVAASDFEQFNDDITAHTQAQLPVINRQSGHARALENYTIERCGVELKVLTAG